MSRGYRYLTINMLTGVLLVGSLSGTAQAVSFISGDGTGCGAGPSSECVTVNPKTTIQPGHPSSAPEVFILNGSGPITAFTRQNVDQWYNPSTPNPINPNGNASLNTMTGLTGFWVSYTDSGVDADPSQTNPPNFESPYPNHNPNPPAVPNYCGTSGTGTGVGGNINPTGTPSCTGKDPKQN